MVGVGVSGWGVEQMSVCLESRAAYIWTDQAEELVTREQYFKYSANKTKGFLFSPNQGTGTLFQFPTGMLTNLIRKPDLQLRKLMQDNG